MRLHSKQPSTCKRERRHASGNRDGCSLGLGARVAYLWCPDGQSGSALTVAVSDVLADRVTTRTWATVVRLHALASG